MQKDDRVNYYAYSISFLPLEGPFQTTRPERRRVGYSENTSEELPEFQRAAANFVAEHGIEAPVQARLLDLSSEVGELSKEYLKSTNYGYEPFEEPPDGWQDELGDVLFSLVCLANSTGVNLDAALQGALDKYKERLRRGGDAGSGGRDY
jgi:NTP pyrophosphatase (non-canonical NTP hydrolase)